MEVKEFSYRHSSEDKKKSYPGYKNTGSGSFKGGALFLVIGIVVVAVVIALFVINANRFKLKDYVKVKYTGTNGYATAEFEVDKDALYKRLAGDSPDADTEYYINKLIDSIVLTTEKVDISNGDTIVVNVEYDEKFEASAGVKLGKKSYKMKASGIGKGIQVELFDKVEVVFKGVSPDAYVVVNNNWENEYFAGLEFEVDKPEKVELGDTITVSCKGSYEDMARHGYAVDKTSAVYVADALPTYAQDASVVNKSAVDELNNEIKAAITSQAEDTTFHILYKATGDDKYLKHLNDEHASEVTFVGAYYLTCKGDQADKNYLYVLMSANVMDKEDTEKLYFAFEYKNCFVTADGKFDVLHEGLDKRYTCKTTSEELYSNLIGSKLELYNCIEIK